MSMLNIMPAYPTFRCVVPFILSLAFALAPLTPVRASAAADLKARLLAGPLHDCQEIVFAARTILQEHWYANIGYWATDSQRPMYGRLGKLCKWNLRTGKLTMLIDDPEGSVRDPSVHYDGHQILFSYRKGGTKNYLLYVINSDGTGLRRVTDGPFDDIEPCWLPDGGIVLVSTRAKRWVNCWSTQVANIWRCDADGGQLRPLSANIEQDNTPWVLPDGRILYTRWEYIDRSQVHYHHLWTMDPDGTGQSVFFGNLHPGGVFIDARPIPESRDVILIDSPGHGATEHAGFVARVDPEQGPDALASLVNISKRADFRDPWAFGSEAIMAAEGNRIVLMNAEGEAAALYTAPPEFGPVWLHEPRPLAPHPREAVIPARVDLEKPCGRFLLQDVLRGRSMAGVKPGEVKRLMVVESLPKPINFTGGMDPLSYGGTFTLERVLGTVPVEADGSAYFEAPALRSLFFIAMDDHDLAVKRMQSFTTVQPGETFGCVGCHEHRSTAPPLSKAAMPLAARRRASKIEPYRDLPDVVDFPRDVQPILDRNCVACHDYGKREGGVILSGDHGPMFSHSYYTLTGWGQLADGRNQPRSNYPPRALGSGGSPMIKLLSGGHYGVKASERDLGVVRIWLDLGAPYPGTYASLGTGSIGGYINNAETLNNDSQWPETLAAQPVFAARCAACHDPRTNPIARSLSDENGLSFWQPPAHDRRLEFSRHIIYNLSRPKESLVLLAPLAHSAGGYGLCKPKGSTADSAVFRSTEDPDYGRLLAMVTAGKRKLDEIKRFDMPGFQPRPEYIREMKRFNVLPASFDARQPLDYYETDRRYWDSFIYRAGSSAK
jgi:hypothetical protein